MNEEQKDKGLKKAMKEQPQFRLPSNFVYRAMQKVEEAALLRERRTERRTLWAIIATSLLLIAGTLTGAWFLFGNSIKESFHHAFEQTKSTFIESSAPYLLFIATLLLLMLFDRWMRKQYFKRNL